MSTTTGIVVGDRTSTKSANVLFSLTFFLNMKESCGILMSRWGPFLKNYAYNEPMPNWEPVLGKTWYVFCKGASLPLDRKNECDK